jgi:hypothetical protein
MVYRLIAPFWLTEANPNAKKVLEGEFNEDQIKNFNNIGYNVYFLPNYPQTYNPGITVNGSHINKFEYVFVDMDLKDKVYSCKDEFIEKLCSIDGLKPSSIVDSGNGVHAYYKVMDLDAMSFLKLNRRLCRFFNTDEAICKIYQLMRMPGTFNTKDKDNYKLCEVLASLDKEYTCENLDKLLPTITQEDEVYCVSHYNSIYDLDAGNSNIDLQLPAKFEVLIRENKEVKKIWLGSSEDRSSSDFRLAHMLYGNGFTREEALSVLANQEKATTRSPKHRISYAENIVKKIWVEEEKVTGIAEDLSSSVEELVNSPKSATKGARLPCYKWFDDTEHGFRLGQVIGLVAGSGVGKTAIALNMFAGFVKNNSELIHFFVPLEQPAEEIAVRWKTMCGGNKAMYEKVRVISNYDSKGGYRNLSFHEIRKYILDYKKKHNVEVGCVVIDHIGVLRKKGAKAGENQDLMDICKDMKAFAVETNTLLIMQSQAPREKADIGDLELNKDAAYGTVFFESYCDYLVTLWQPLKRVYGEDPLTITAFKFCKIRYKKQGFDNIKEDTPYHLVFDPQTEHLRELTQEDEIRFKHLLAIATNKRKNDRKTDLVEYTSARGEEQHGKTDSNRYAGNVSSPKGLH